MHRIKTLKKASKKASFYSLSALLALSAVAVVFAGNTAHAAQLSQSMVRFDRIMVSQQTTGTVCAEPSTAATEASVQVVFPTGYTLGTAGNFTVSTTNLAWPTGGTAWPGVNTATNVTSQTVTFPSGDLSVGTLYCFNWTNSAAVQVKSGATSNNAGTITTRDSVPAAIDTADYSTASISDDQIDVSATVPQSFSFALSATTDALGSLNSGSVTTSPTPRTATVNTNAPNGWMVWARDANTGLTSTAASKTIASTTPGSNSTLSSGSEGYNFGVTTSQGGGSGTISIAAAFVGTGAGQGGGLDTTLRTLTSSDGTAQNAVLTLKNNAAISSLTPAATDYADTITLVGAGLF
jgi:hypothetical protein